MTVEEQHEIANIANLVSTELQLRRRRRWKNTEPPTWARDILIEVDRRLRRLITLEARDTR
jgi:hypothetical protein